MCSKERFLELIHDFMVFDAGVKKTARHNQYFGVKAAQARVAKREGGIIWHTQGSGKSLTMVWLAKWIREHQRRLGYCSSPIALNSMSRSRRSSAASTSKSTGPPVART